MIIFFFFTAEYRLLENRVRPMTNRAGKYCTYVTRYRIISKWSEPSVDKTSCCHYYYWYFLVLRYSSLLFYNGARTSGHHKDDYFPTDLRTALYRVSYRIRIVDSRVFVLGPGLFLLITHLGILLDRWFSVCWTFPLYRR